MNAEPTFLLIDNSNTRTKFILASAGQLHEERRILPTADITSSSVHELLKDWSYDEIFISSVVPDACHMLCDSLAPTPTHCLSASSQLNFDISVYEGKNTIGADRLANAAGLTSYGRYPAIAVDLGTAVTYEALARGASGVFFAGGAIAPGISSLARVLSSSTALLPQVDARVRSNALAQHTLDALRAGTYYGYMGMLRETLCMLTHELGAQPLVVLTGGDASLVHAYDNEFGILDEQLTMKGLLVLATLNCTALQ